MAPPVYVPFKDARARYGLCVDTVLQKGDAEEILQITHHKAHPIPEEAKRPNARPSADTALNALKARPRMVTEAETVQ